MKWRLGARVGTRNGLPAYAADRLPAYAAGLKAAGGDQGRWGEGRSEAGSGAARGR